MAWHWTPIPYLNTGGNGWVDTTTMIIVNTLIWIFGVGISLNIVIWPTRWLVLGSRAVGRTIAKGSRENSDQRR